MASKITPSGRKMIERYLALEVKASGFTAYKPLRDATGRLLLALAPGDGAAAATLRKLVRDGFAEGRFDSLHGRWMVPTEKGRAAVSPTPTGPR